MSSPLLPLIAWKVPCPGAVSMLTSALSKTNCTKASTKSGRRVLSSAHLPPSLHFIVALSQHKTAEYVSQLLRPVLLPVLRPVLHLPPSLHFIVALSQHKTAEYVSQLLRPVLLVDKRCKKRGRNVRPWAAHSYDALSNSFILHV